MRCDLCGEKTKFLRLTCDKCRLYIDWKNKQFIKLRNDTLQNEKILEEEK